MYRGYLTRTNADAEHLLAVRAEQRRHRQQRAEKRRQSRWGWLREPENVGLIATGAVVVWLVAQAV